MSQGSLSQQSAYPPYERNEPGLQAPSHEAMTFVLIGSPGSGKSATANTILGAKRMETSCTSQRVTKKIQYEQVNKNGIHLTVIDTPGFISTEDVVATMNEIQSSNIKKLIIGVTFRIGRITEDEIGVLNNLLLNSKYSKYLHYRTCFVFTNKDDFNGCDDSMMIEDVQLDKLFEDWLEETPNIRNMIRYKKFSYCAITNGLEGEERIEESNKMMKKLKDLSDTDFEYDMSKVHRISDFSNDVRLDEIMLFTVREIRDLLTDVRNRRRSEDVTHMIFITLQNRGSSLKEKDVKKLFGLEASSCTIL